MATNNYHSREKQFERLYSAFFKVAWYCFRIQDKIVFRGFILSWVNIISIYFENISTGLAKKGCFVVSLLYLFFCDLISDSMGYIGQWTSWSWYITLPSVFNVRVTLHFLSLDFKNFRVNYTNWRTPNRYLN